MNTNPIYQKVNNVAGKIIGEILIISSSFNSSTPILLERSVLFVNDVFYKLGENVCDPRVGFYSIVNDIEIVQLPESKFVRTEQTLDYQIYGYRTEEGFVTQEVSVLGPKQFETAVAWINPGDALNILNKIEELLSKIISE
jgi:hypothetical protein